MIRFARLVLVLMLVVSFGCGGGPSYEIGVKQDLMILGLEMHNARAKTQAELEERSNDAKLVLAKNNYVYLPGSDTLADDRWDYIVAYHKDTPTKGGYALDGGGGVKLYTKEEFAATRKWDPNAKAEPASAGEEASKETPKEAPKEAPSAEQK